MRLLTSEFCTIDFDPVRSIVRYTRSERPYRTTAEILTEAERITVALSAVGGGKRILVDLRAAQPRNDPAFEAAIGTLRHAVYGQASRAAILVRTAVGVLQTQRHVREDGVVAQVFETENHAINYLLTGHFSERPPSTRH